MFFTLPHTLVMLWSDCCFIIEGEKKNPNASSFSWYD